VISLSELPLVIGLFLVSPLALVVVRLVAVVPVLIKKRREPFKIFFNLVLFATEVVVAFAIIRLFGRSDVGDPLSWLAVLVAVLAVTVLSTLAIQTVIRLAQGPQPLAGAGAQLVISLAIAIANG